MTRKDFHLIASVFAEQESTLQALYPLTQGVAWGTLYATVESMADQLAKTNPRFDRGRFMSAALPIRNKAKHGLQELLMGSDS